MKIHLLGSVLYVQLDPFPGMYLLFGPGELQPVSTLWAGDTGQRRGAGAGSRDRKQSQQETEEQIEDIRWEEEQDKTGDEEDN